MIDREALENREYDYLASYAVKAKDSKGRKHHDPEHPLRTCFQRDKGRIIHSTAFRRLEYKTQVFVNHEGDHYRTRLTHSLEVAQISRAIARAMALNEDLAETVAISHDLGHPPFGHSGETALNSLMKNAGGFEHNIQSLRVVDKLEHAYKNFPGLNLSYEVRACMVMHSSLFMQSKKPAWLDEFVCAKAPCLEGQVVDIADSLAYTTHDLDDGLRSGILTEDHLKGLALWEEAKAQRIPTTDFLGLRKQYVQTAGYLVNTLITDLITASEKRLKDNGITSLEEVQQQDSFLIGFSDDVKAKLDELKAVLFKHFYRNYKLNRLSAKAERFISTLFNEYCQQSQQLPPAFRKWAEVEGTERAVCDYIAGMTDRFAQDEYKNLFDPYESL